MCELTYCVFRADDDRDYAIEMLKSLQSIPVGLVARVQAESLVSVYPYR